MSSKRQRKKIYKKMGVWGFDAIVTGVRRDGQVKGIKHGFSIGTLVKFVSESYVACDCKSKDYNYSQWVWKNHLKKIR